MDNSDGLSWPSRTQPDDYSPRLLMQNNLAQLLLKTAVRRGLRRRRLPERLGMFWEGEFSSKLSTHPRHLRQKNYVNDLIERPERKSIINFMVTFIYFTC